MLLHVEFGKILDSFYACWSLGKNVFNSFTDWFKKVNDVNVCFNNANFKNEFSKILN